MKKQKRNNAVGPQVRELQAKRSKLIPSLTITSLATGLACSTQYFARMFDYHPALGAHFQHIYVPWKILEWAAKWHERYPDALVRAGSVGMLVTSVALFAITAFATVKRNSSKANEYLHGSARWANRQDIERAGLLGNDGVYVGAWIDENGGYHYLRHDGPEHVLCYAPTRSGKGVGLVNTSLWSWPHSALITDLKGELWEMTAGWRQKLAGNKVLRFDPATPGNSVAWNPCREVRIGTHYEVGDAQNLAQIIVDPDGKGLETHWQKTSFKLITGLILHSLYLEKHGLIPAANLPYIDQMLSDPDKPLETLWGEMKTFEHTPEGVHPAVARGAQEIQQTPDEERGSVISTASSFFSLYRDPVIAKNVAHSDFKLKDLMNADTPVSLYLITNPNNRKRLRPLVRILITMAFTILVDKMKFKNGRAYGDYKHRLLFLADEFPSLGKLDIVEESLAFCAGYGIKCYLIAQDLEQLRDKEAYGPEETITSNCHIQNAYPPGKLETAKHISEKTGITTIVKAQITESGKRASSFLGQVSRTTQEVQRPLLTVDEAMRMPAPEKAGDKIVTAGDMLIFVQGMPAIYGKQPLYFKDAAFLARAKIPAPANSDRFERTANAQHKAIAL